MNTGVYILPKLNTYGIPIVNKYHEGKLKNALVRGWNRVWTFADGKRNKKIFSANWVILKHFEVWVRKLS